MPLSRCSSSSDCSSRSTGPRPAWRSASSRAERAWGGAAGHTQTNPLQASNKPVADTIPTEGATGWGDTWMLATNATHPNCAYLWTAYVSTPKVQALQALYFGETPVNTKACAEMEALQAGSCAQYHADAPGSYFDTIKFWKTPIAQCPDGINNSIPAHQWVDSWTTIKG